MRKHLPKAALIGFVGCLALAGCGEQVKVVDHEVAGTTDCPNMDPVAQKYMHGTPSVPVRCEPQKVNYWDPTVTTTGGHSTPTAADATKTTG
ncbi:hypothetical protein [Acidimangrovimonas sediminis]|uniref:hypothetical protein n=1 Tax=Acidimangrovimonas sediminis TaxID=2056283 RepID=UPI000C80B9D6|nr:hypothetical protein [Acidimangrovimonas sediminis]